jgi:hypothetical protein
VGATDISLETKGGTDPLNWEKPASWWGTMGYLSRGRYWQTKTISKEAHRGVHGL